MVREIMHDEKFLSQKAEPATKDDMETAQDLAWQQSVSSS